MVTLQSPIDLGTADAADFIAVMQGVLDVDYPGAVADLVRKGEGWESIVHLPGRFDPILLEAVAADITNMEQLVLHELASRT